MKRTTNYFLAGTACLLLLMTACEDGESLSSVPEGTPLTVTAGIEYADGIDAVTRAATAENDYDRSRFQSGDRIRVTRTRSGSASSTVDYKFDGTSWSPYSAGSELLFESGATYQAVYPLDYNGVRNDQREKENYRLSNRMETRAGVEASRTGELSFTGATDQFKHINAKLTLTFTGTNNLSGALSLVVKGAGLYSGGNSEEEIHPFRPDDTAYTWVAVMAPKSSGTTKIEVTVTTANGVSYQCDCFCAMNAGKNYIYTLTIQNNVLVPVGKEIENWTNQSVYDGTLS